MMALPTRLFVPMAVLGLVAGAPSLQATETDGRIIAAAKGSHNFKTYLLDDKINIVSKNGCVTLTGKVQDEFHRALAEETLAGLPAVKSVNNQLNIVEAPGGLDPDAALRVKVQAALLFHRRLSAVQTKVSVDKGVVTLRGVAASEEQKALAGSHVLGLDGVTAVVNDMTVGDPHPKRRAIRRKIDDASLTAQVKLALLFTRATRGAHTKVITENGIVELSGTAKSRAEKDQATRVAQTVDGIKAVHNRMSVEG